MKESTRNTLDAVLKTLDSVSVCGKRNMDMLLGCIMALEKIDEPIEAEETGGE